MQPPKEQYLEEVREEWNKYSEDQDGVILTYENVIDFWLAKLKEAYSLGAKEAIENQAEIDKSKNKYN